MKKGITPIISILVLVLVTVSLAGASWIFISSYFSGIASKKVEITGAACSGSLATIYLKNIGTDAININDCIGENNDYTCGDIALKVTQADDSGMPLPWGAKTLGPGQVVGLTSSCSGSCQYKIIQSYSTFPVLVQCSAPPPLTGGMEGGGNLVLEFSEETEPDTIVLRSNPVTLRCTKKTTVLPIKYECTNGNITVSCITNNNKRFECKITGLEIHNEVQVIGKNAGTSTPSAGKVNLNYVCTPGESSECGTNIGACRKGNRICTANGTWSDCQGAVNPQPEICGNSLDDNCDGLVNNGCTPPPANDTTPPTLTAYFTRITDTSATLVIDAFDNGSYVKYTGLWYNASPGHLGAWVAWGEMYYFCNNTIFCHQEHVTTPTTGPGTYRFWIMAYNRDNIWSETYASVNFAAAPATDMTPPNVTAYFTNMTNTSAVLVVDAFDYDSYVKETHLMYRTVHDSSWSEWYPEPYRSCNSQKHCYQAFAITNINGPGSYEFWVQSYNRDLRSVSVYPSVTFQGSSPFPDNCTVQVDPGNSGIKYAPTRTCTDSLGTYNFTECVSERSIGFVLCYRGSTRCEGNLASVCASYVCRNATCLDVVPQCTETDGGINYSIKGSITLHLRPFGNQEDYTLEDSCSTESLLIEYYCYNNRLWYTGHFCENGKVCRDGACISVPSTDTTPPSVSAYFVNITNSSAELLATAIDRDSYVNNTELRYMSPNYTYWHGWGSTLYSCYMLQDCYHRYNITAVDGPGTYHFLVKAYNRDGVYSSTNTSVTFYSGA